jgi:hypothetical protein
VYPTQDLCLIGKDLVFGGSPQNSNASVQQLGHDEADVVYPEETVDDPTMWTPVALLVAQTTL